MAITCVGGFCFSPVENKNVPIRKQSLNFGGFLFKNRQTNRASEEDLHLVGVWGRLQSWGEQHRSPWKQGGTGRVSGLSFEVVLAPHVSILGLSVSSGLQELPGCPCGRGSHPPWERAAH